MLASSGGRVADLVRTLRRIAGPQEAGPLLDLGCEGADLAAEVVSPAEEDCWGDPEDDYWTDRLNDYPPF